MIILLHVCIFLFLVLLSFSSISLSISETDALLKFKNSISGAKELDSWVPNTTPCDKKSRWFGIMCNKGVITGLHLPGMGLSGQISVDALLEIDTLRTILLSNNSFSGPIPGFNRIGALKALYLSYNNFSGEIPLDYFLTMGSLKKLGLEGNKFYGRIPDSLGKIPRLMEVHLENNEFSSFIPEMTQTSLVDVDFSNNKLVGEIPPSLSRFDAMFFQRNAGLCGQPLPKNCNAVENPTVEVLAPDGADPPRKNSSWMGWVVMVVIAFAVLLALFITSKMKR